MFRGLARKLDPHKFTPLSCHPKYDCEGHIGKGEKKVCGGVRISCQHDQLPVSGKPLLKLLSQRIDVDWPERY
jgi:hypothetical protein